MRDFCAEDEGKPRFADLASRTASLPLLLAARSDLRLKAQIADAWGWSALTPARVRELGGS